MSDIEQAKAAVEAADRARRAVEREIRDAEEAAKAAIRAQFDARLKAAWEGVNDARAALVAAQDQTPDHPWTGKRVFRMEQRGRVWERRTPIRIEGIVETVRSTTVFPENTAQWRCPGIGQPIVRLLKKDGSPSKRFEEMSRHTSWKLAEAEP